MKTDGEGTESVVDALIEEEMGAIEEGNLAAAVEAGVELKSLTGEDTTFVVEEGEEAIIDVLIEEEMEAIEQGNLAAAAEIEVELESVLEENN
jgi:hypothetical protein